MSDVGGLIYSAYIMTVPGMVLMFLGALFGKRGQAVAPGVLTAGWSWTAATFWRATSDRFNFTAIGGVRLSNPPQKRQGGRLRSSSHDATTQPTRELKKYANFVQ
jgi:hypothetical protein